MCVFDVCYTESCPRVLSVHITINLYFSGVPSYFLKPVFCERKNRSKSSFLDEQNRGNNVILALNQYFMIDQRRAVCDFFVWEDLLYMMFIIVAGLGIVTPGNVLALLEFSLEIGLES